MSARKKWRREISPLDKPALIEELQAFQAHMHAMKLEFAVHPAREDAKTLDHLIETVAQTLEKLGFKKELPPSPSTPPRRPNF